MNTSKIAKNTLLLYVRMGLIMIINLYMVRLLLKVLGVEDYGIYNVVAGFVSVLSFLSGTMSSACMRFFAYEIGRDDLRQLKITFGVALTIFLFLGIVSLSFFETFGVWFINFKMNIPLDRLKATNWIFQFSIATYIFTIIRIPYSSLLLAYEKMDVFAYLSVFESVLKLIFLFLVPIIPLDQLILYGGIVLLSSIISTLFYVFCCLKRFRISRVGLLWHRKSVVSMLSFSSWNMVGALSSVAKMQGLNILLNIYFGPLINAAVSIANQINSALQSFLSNLNLAVRPQITKSYANKEFKNMLTLTFVSSKYSFFLLLLISMPLLLETDYILGLWLKEIPEFTSLFSRLLILSFLIESINSQFYGLLQAIGKIKLYQIIICSLLLLVLPISYLLLKSDYTHYNVFIVSIVLNLISFVPQILIVRNIVNFSIKKYINDILLPVIITTLTSIILPFVLINLLEPSFLRFSLICLVSIISWALSVIFVGSKRVEREYIIAYIKNKKK